MTSDYKMREALEFYADPTNWISGDVPGHVYTIEDAGGIAREALKDQPKIEPVGWWDGDSRFTRHETLPQKHNWDIVHPLYIVPPAALHSVEAEKEPEWTPESERHLEQQLTLLARLENSEARISELESLVRQYHVALSGAPGTSPCNCMTESSRPEDHQKICPVSVLSRPAPPEHKPE